MAMLPPRRASKTFKIVRRMPLSRRSYVCIVRGRPAQKRVRTADYTKPAEPDVA